MHSLSDRCLAAGAGIVLALGATFAQAAGQTVPGEKWQMKMSMQMPGMNMPMQSSESCVPVGQANPEDVAKPDKNCTYSNVRRSGNKFSADLQCTGKDPFKGSVEMTTEANRMSGRAKVLMEGEEMTLTMESVKTGVACQAVSAEAVQAAVDKQVSAAKAMSANVDVCGAASRDLAKNPGQIAAAAMMYVKPGATCAGKATPAFCAAAQTRAGFSNLQSLETTEKGITAASLAACKLGGDKAAVDALRAKLVASAEADGDASFLMAQAPARAKDIVRTQCVLKGEMWGSRSPKWDAFCDSNFAESVRSGK